MYRLLNIAPTIDQSFMEGKFVIKRTPGHFKAVGADMALEQTINSLRRAQQESSVVQDEKTMLLSGR